MPSLDDIPDHLLDPLRRIDFVHWLANVPLDWPATRAIMRLWIQQTGMPITDEQFGFLRRNRGATSGF